MLVSNTSAAGAMDPAAQALQMADMLEALVPARPQSVQDELQQTHAAIQECMKQMQATMQTLATQNISLSAELVAERSSRRESERVHQVAMEAQRDLIATLQQRLDASDARTQLLTEKLTKEITDLSNKLQTTQEHLSQFESKFSRHGHYSSSGGTGGPRLF